MFCLDLSCMFKYFICIYDHLDILAGLASCDKTKTLDFVMLIRVFHEHTELAIMVILASEALRRKNQIKTHPSTKCYPIEH